VGEVGRPYYISSTETSPEPEDATVTHKQEEELMNTSYHSNADVGDSIVDSDADLGDPGRDSLFITQYDGSKDDKPVNKYKESKGGEISEEQADTDPNGLFILRSPVLRKPELGGGIVHGIEVN
jgi:hypothetical protein